MRKAATRGDVGHLRRGASAQEFPPRAFEAGVPERVERRLAEKSPELPLERSRRAAGNRGELAEIKRPSGVSLHRVQGAAHAMRKSGMAQPKAGLGEEAWTTRPVTRVTTYQNLSPRG